MTNMVKIIEKIYVRRDMNGNIPKNNHPKYKLTLEHTPFIEFNNTYKVLDFIPKKTNNELSKAYGFVEYNGKDTNIFLVNKTINDKINEILSNEKTFKNIIAPFYLGSNGNIQNELYTNLYKAFFYHELGHVLQLDDEDDLSSYPPTSQRIVSELKSDFNISDSKVVSYFDKLRKMPIDEAKKIASVRLAAGENIGYNNKNDPVKSIKNNVNYLFLFQDINLEEKQKEILSLINKMEKKDMSIIHSFPLMVDYNKTLINSKK